MKDGRVHWIKLLSAKFYINYYGTICPTEVTFIAVMEVTPNSPDSLTLGTVIKQITIPHILYKDSSMRGKAFRHLYSRKYSLLTENSKFTNFIIGGLLAGPHQSPLIQCSYLQDTTQRSSAFETYQPTDIQGTITYPYQSHLLQVKQYLFQYFQVKQSMYLRGRESKKCIVVT